MKRLPKVALLIETSNSYARGLLRGIVSYIRENGQWSIYLSEHNRGDRPPKWLTEWKGDGIVARIENAAIAQVLKDVRIPVVDVSAARLLPNLPWFETDDAEIARLAFEHLRERGFRSFGYCGDSHFNWSNWRMDQFARLARAEGFECAIYKPSQGFALDDEQQIDDIGRWLGTIRKPVGIMACYDLRGQQVLDACRRHGIAVPDEVAVVGVDNDDLLCELSHPPLTSVIPNTARTGYEAAKLLDQLMRNQPGDAEHPHLIPPLGIATRQSTDTLAIEDRQLAKAVKFIRDRACEGINVADVLREVPQARRVLESHFKKTLGRTPHQEIIRVRLERVKRLLSETELTLDAIAERVGFSHVEYLSVAFKREVGMPPSKYRNASKPR